jgi:uncharacterized protein
LSEVKPNGSVFCISQGITRVKAEARPVTISLQPTCIQIPPGSALRLSLSGACFPAYAVNAGDGSPSGQGDLMTAKVITLMVKCGGDRPSRLLVPIVKA